MNGLTASEEEKVDIKTMPELEKVLSSLFAPYFRVEYVSSETPSKFEKVAHLYLGEGSEWTVLGHCLYVDDGLKVIFLQLNNKWYKKARADWGVATNSFSFTDTYSFLKYMMGKVVDVSTADMILVEYMNNALIQTRNFTDEDYTSMLDQAKQYGASPLSLEQKMRLGKAGFLVSEVEGWENAPQEWVDEVTKIKRGRTLR